MRIFYHHLHTISSKKLWGLLVLFIILFVLMTFNAKAQVQLLNFSPTTNDVAPVNPVYTLEFDRTIMFNTSGTTAPKLTLYRQSDNTVRYFLDRNSNFISISGSTVTVNVPFFVNRLESDEGYYFLLDAGMFLDFSNPSLGNAAITSTTEWTFHTRPNDGTAPQLLSVTPDFNATKIGPTTEIKIVFDEPVHTLPINDIANSYLGRSGTTSKTQFSSTTLSADRKTLTLAPDAFIAKNEAYWVIINEFGTGSLSSTPVIYDDDGNGFAGFLTDTDWRFSAIEDPIFTDKSPADDATNVDPTTTVSFTLNNDINAATSAGLVRLYTYDDNQIFAQADIASGTGVTINGNQMTMDFGLLNPNTRYFVRLPFANFEGVVDEFGVKISEQTQLSDKDTWDFTTGASSNNPITDITLSPSSFLEGNERFQVVGQLTAIDADANDTHTFAIPRNPVPAGTNNDFFDVVGNELRVTVEAFDFDLIQSFVVRVIASDGMGSQFEKDITITLLEDTSPEVSNYSPSNGATHVDPTTNSITITLSEVVNAGSTGQFILANTTDGAAELIYNATDPELSGWGTHQITVTFDANYPGLELGDIYSPYTANGFFEDLEGNPVDVPVNTYTFTIDSNPPADTTPPSITGFLPNDGAMGIETANSLIRVNFDEPVLQGTGTFELINTTANPNTADQIISASSSQVTGWGTDQITIHFNSGFSLNGGTTYQPYTYSNFFKDAAGNTTDIALGSYTFTTEILDTTPPSVTGYSPTNGSSNVSFSLASLQFIFDEPVFEGISGTFGLQNNTASTIEQIIPYDSDQITGWGTDQITVTFGSNFNLTPSASYTVYTIDDFFGDAAGNTTDLTLNDYTFTAEVDNVRPTIVSTIPADDATDVDPNIGTFEITLSETVIEGNSGSFELYRLPNNGFIKDFQVGTADMTVSGTMITLHNVPPLEANTSYWIRQFNSAGETTVTDLAGNELANFTSSAVWNFTTSMAVDADPPALLSTSPANGTTGVSRFASIDLTFDEPVQNTNSGGFFRFLNEDGSTFANSFTFNTSLVSFNGNTITVSPSTPFIFGNTYYLTLDAGAIKDAAGNSSTGWNDDTVLKFTVQAEPVVITALSPSDEDSNVPKDIGQLSITFDQPFTINTASTQRLRLRRKGSNTIVKEFDPSNDLSQSGNTLFLNNVPLLGEGAGYWVQSSNTEDIVLDTSGNPLMTEWNDDETWDFVTEQPDTQAPSVVSTSPDDDAINVSANLSALSITFDEPIQIGSGRVSIRRVSDDAAHQDAGATAPGFLSISGNTLTINQGNAFLYETEWYVNIDAGVVLDLNGNAFAGINDNFTWSFTTEAASVAPAVPSTPNLTVVSSTQITVSFTDNSDDESGFEIERGTELDGNGNPAGTVVTFTLGAHAGTGEVTYEDNEANSGTVNAPKPGQTYHYRVRAFKN